MRTVLAVLVALFVLAAPAAADELTPTREEQLSPRLHEYGFTTPALADETNVRVLLPDGYEADPDRRYPVLYLLHGCCDFDVPGSRAWTTHGEAEAATAGLPLIVVMPDGGRGGFYSDWFHHGAGGPPEWETYHIDQLMPWVDAHFRTRAAREGRVVAGLSMGGFGAMSYAARHPDRFVAAASFSGAVDTNRNPALDGLSVQDGGGPTEIWGDRVTEETRWRGHNPWDLAQNLAPLQLTLRTGNGQRGPLDEPGGAPVDPLEASVHDMTVSLHERFDALGLPHVFDDYGPGTHSWPYWARDLRQTLPDLMAVLDHPPAPPARVDYRAIDPAYVIFGWRVAFDRAGVAFSRLSGADASGFTLEGPGAATVTTPARYRPGAPAAATVDGVRQALTVAGDGSLAVPVPDGGSPRTVRIDAPAPRTECLRTARVPRGLRHVRVRSAGRRLAVRHRRYVVRVPARVVVTGRRHGVRVRVIRWLRRCG